MRLSMHNFIIFVRLVLRRAWVETRAAIVPTSTRVIVRDGIIFFSALVLVYFARGLLVSEGIIPTGENPAVDPLIMFFATMTVLSALFVCYFAIEMVILSPFRVWEDARKEADEVSLILGVTTSTLYESFKSIESFSLSEAASLWIGEVPGKPQGVNYQSMYLRLRGFAEQHGDTMKNKNASLVHAAEEAKQSGKTNSLRPSTRITRLQLREIAALMGEAPIFLFGKPAHAGKLMMSFREAEFILPYLERFSHAQTWYPSETDLLRMLGEQVEGEYSASDGATFQRAEIDFAAAMFKYYWISSSNERCHAVKFHPWDIDSARPSLNHLPAEVAEGLLDRARAVWKRMGQRLAGLVASGRIQVRARVANPTEPYSVIPPDSWRHYTIIDWERGEAMSSAGQHLYSVHYLIDEHSKHDNPATSSPHAS
jgi:hypothetical protein